jgi:hypothetical protein
VTHYVKLVHRDVALIDPPDTIIFPTDKGATEKKTPRREYLLFLQNRRDGKYTLTSGYYRPNVSVRELKSVQPLEK